VTIVDLDVPTHGAQPRQAQGAPREAGGDPEVSQDDVVLGERLDVRRRTYLEAAEMHPRQSFRVAVVLGGLHLGRVEPSVPVSVVVHPDADADPTAGAVVAGRFVRDLRPENRTARGALRAPVVPPASDQGRATRQSQNRILHHHRSPRSLSTESGGSRRSYPLTTAMKMGGHPLKILLRANGLVLHAKPTGSAQAPMSLSAIWISPGLHPRAAQPTSWFPRCSAAPGPSSSAGALEQRRGPRAAPGWMKGRRGGWRTALVDGAPRGAVRAPRRDRSRYEARHDPSPPRRLGGRARSRRPLRGGAPRRSTSPDCGVALGYADGQRDRGLADGAARRLARVPRGTAGGGPAPVRRRRGAGWVHHLLGVLVGDGAAARAPPVRPGRRLRGALGAAGDRRPVRRIDRRASRTRALTTTCPPGPSREGAARTFSARPLRCRRWAP